MQIHPTLKPTDRERAKAFWRSIESEGTPFELQYGRYQPKKAIKKGKAKVQVVQEEISVDDESEDLESVNTQKFMFYLFSLFFHSNL